MSKYKMPEVHVGQGVLWYDAGDINARPYAAIVTAVGDEAIAVWIIGPGAHNGMTRDGVRHVGDPNKRPESVTDAGCWDHTEQTYKLEAVAEMLLRLKKELEGPTPS